MKPISFSLLLSLLLLAGSADAQTDTLSQNPAPIENAVRDLVKDSTPVSVGDSVVAELKAPVAPKPLSVRAVVIPSAMIAYGALTLTNKNLQRLNRTVREEIWQDRNNGAGKTTKIDNYTIWVPAVAVYGLNLAGVKGKNNLVDRSFIYGLSNLIGNGLVFSTKKFSHVMRPDSSNYYSFPSGHTAKAFLAAEFLRQEYKHRSPWYGVAGYAVAIGSGVLRMYNNKHWLNDVVAGAGVGILSTRLAYWLYPKLKNGLVRSDKRERKSKSTTMLLPTYEYGAAGIGLVHQF